MSAAVLIVEDEANLARNIASYLGRQGHETRVAGTAEEGLEEAARFAPDVVLLDLRLPGMGGLEALRELRAGGSDARVVIMTAHGDVQTAVEALKAGAWDYVTKPLVLRDLARLLEKAAGEERIAGRLRYYASKEEGRRGVAAILGSSPPMLGLKEAVLRLAERERAMPPGATPPAVMVLGETGTGKELVARAVHFEGARSAGPIIEINCAALPPHLVEDELFGHERGAFTDARERKAGLVEAADGGTLFLDEIGEMELAVQAKVLKLLEDQRVRRLGAVREIKVDVRIVAATNRRLEDLVREGRFRPDLYFRLRTVEIALPPLRERGRDVLLLAQGFLEAAATRYGRGRVRLDPAAERALLGHGWPGNVRELKNVIEQAVLLSTGAEIGPDRLALSGLGVPDAPIVEGFRLPAEGIELERLEADLIGQALERTAWNVTAAAKLLGLGRDALRYRVEKLGLERPD